jgi:hypothetical protein
VFVKPAANERGVWEWSAVASYEGPLKGSVGARRAASGQVVAPHEVAATIRAALLARCQTAAVAPISGGSHDDGGTESGSSFVGPPSKQAGGGASR